MRWIVLVVRLPADPSRHRVAVWRALHRVGALSLGQGVWALPAINSPPGSPEPMLSPSFRQGALSVP
jgi:Protein ChrB, N-terminal